MRPFVRLPMCPGEDSESGWMSGVITSPERTESLAVDRAADPHTSWYVCPARKTWAGPASNHAIFGVRVVSEPYKSSWVVCQVPGVMNSVIVPDGGMKNSLPLNPEAALIAVSSGPRIKLIWSILVMGLPC